MKKFFTLALLFLGLSLGTAQAQERKTWDFSKGWSDETIENLTNGSEWTLDGTSWKETGKFSGEFVANGQPIKELIGLTRGSAGLSKNNNYLLTASSLRLNRNNMVLNFPKLANGQKLTIMGRSANGTATNRGVKASYDYMVRVDEDKENNLMLGGQVEGSKGTYTFVYEIQTEGTDSVPVQITMITGGIDFTLFMIDEGDVVPSAKVAYLYNGTEDNVLKYLQARENTELTAINVTTETVSAEQLQGFDVTIVGAGIAADNAALAVVKEALPWTPVLNLNNQAYPAWGYGEALVTEEATSLVVPGACKKNALYKDIDLLTEEGVTYLELTDAESAVLNGVTLGDYFAGDPMIAFGMNAETAGIDSTFVGIHTHNVSHNGYIYMPYFATYTEAGQQVLNNAIANLQASKAEITPANAPAISRIYKDKMTRVVINAPKQPKAKVFYTIDGSEPTEQSTLYTDTIDLTEPCTLKAAAIAEGYTLSKPAEMAVEIKSQPKTPVIAYEMKGEKTVVTITCESEDADIWYNFTEAGTDTLKSTRYVDSVAVEITMPQTVTAFAVAGGEVFSELAVKRVLVEKPRVVIDVATHFAAAQWTTDNNAAGIKTDNGKGMFSWGASAVSMYVGEGKDSTVVDPETGDETVIKIYADEDAREPEVVLEPGETPEWKLVSSGTCLIWQNTGAQTTNFGSNDNYNPMYSTDVDPLFPVSKNDIQFYKFFANEPGNGSIQTINKYQAPLDVVVLANMAGGPLLVQVSADSLEWTTIGTIEKTGYSRMWSKYTSSYNGEDAVYVRVTEEAASAGPKVFDIYIANQGEKSKALLDELTAELSGIEEVAVKTVSATAGIYSLNGLRLNRMQRGLNIVVEKNGQVRKIIVK